MKCSSQVPGRLLMGFRRLFAFIGIGRPDSDFEPILRDSPRRKCD